MDPGGRLRRLLCSQPTVAYVEAWAGLRARAARPAGLKGVVEPRGICTAGGGPVRSLVGYFGSRLNNPVDQR